MNEDLNHKITRYTLKKLPIQGDVNFPNVGTLQRRIEDLEAIINLLKLDFTATEKTPLPEEVKNLFTEDTSFKTAFPPQE